MILGPFRPNLGKMNFPGKKGPVSLYTIVPKIRKNYSAISDKNTKLTGAQTDRQW